MFLHIHGDKTDQIDIKEIAFNNCIIHASPIWDGIKFYYDLFINNCILHPQFDCCSYSTDEVQKYRNSLHIGLTSGGKSIFYLIAGNVSHSLQCRPKCVSVYSVGQQLFDDCCVVRYM